MEEKNKLFVGNVSYDTTIETLVELFGKYGEVTDSYKPMRKGFAFITFKSPDDAAKAMEAMNGQTVDGREIFVNYARPREERPQNNSSASAE